MSQRAANANAAHGLSHAMFEQGDMETGRSFLSQWMPAHDRRDPTALDTGDLDGALATYEQHIKRAGRPYPPLKYIHRRHLVVVPASESRHNTRCRR